MYLLVVILILIVWAIIGAKEAFEPKATHIPTPEEHDQILREMVGKSQTECRKIVKNIIIRKMSNSIWK